MSKNNPTVAATTGQVVTSVTVTPLGPPIVPAPPEFFLAREGGGVVLREDGTKIIREAG